MSRARTELACLKASFAEPLPLPRALLERSRQSAADIRAIEMAAGIVPALTAESRYRAALAAIESIPVLEDRHHV